MNTDGYFEVAIKTYLQPNKHLDFQDLINRGLIVKASEVPGCIEFIKSRGFESSFIDKFYYATDDITIGGRYGKYKNSILLPLNIGDNVYGFYSRNISEKLFNTYMDPNWTGYKVWNLWNVDFEQPVYFCESPFDALALMQIMGNDNVCACMGTTIAPHVISMIKQPIIALDNDRSGFKATLSIVEKNPRSHVLFHDERSADIKDYNDMLQKGDCYLKLETGASAIIELKKRLA